MPNKDNPKKGALFEEAVGRFVASQRIRVRRGFVLPIGVGDLKRPRKFDLGSDTPKVVVECKSHSWTAGGNAPSAKLSVWNESMYYFSLVPDHYRKMMFVLLSRFDQDGETLLSYYIRRFGHLIPHGVEMWEFNAESGAAELVHAAKSK